MARAHAGLTSPPADSTTVTVHVTGSPAPAPPPAPGGHLSFTGLPAAVLVAGALALLIAGAVLSGIGRSTSRRLLMSRRIALMAGVAIVAVAAVAPAFADSSSTTVTLATPTAGTRQLDLLDLSGQPLTNLALTSGAAQPFRVRVTDNQINDLTTGFTVSATMSNLYRSTGANTYAWTDKVPSSDVTLSFATNPFSALGLSYDALPKVSLSGLIPTCGTLVSSLGLLLSDLTNAGLCSVLGLTGVSVSGVTVPSSIDAVVSGAVRAPYDLAGQDPGGFTNPDWSTGIGNQAAPNDPSYNSSLGATPHNVMVGTFTGVNNLLADINGAVATASSGLTGTVSGNGTGAYASAADAISALINQGQSALGSALAALSVADQVAILNELTPSVVTPTVAELAKEIGTYNAFPALTVTPAAGTPSGTYQGTLTVTMVQP